MNPYVTKIFERLFRIPAEALISCYEAGDMTADGNLAFEALVALGEG